jgi:hypothetical protein
MTPARLIRTARSLVRFRSGTPRRCHWQVGESNRPKWPGIDRNHRIHVPDLAIDCGSLQGAPAQAESSPPGSRRRNQAQAAELGDFPEIGDELLVGFAIWTTTAGSGRPSAEYRFASQRWPWAFLWVSTWPKRKKGRKPLVMSGCNGNVIRPAHIPRQTFSANGVCLGWALCRLQTTAHPAATPFRAKVFRVTRRRHGIRFIPRACKRR